MSDDGESCEPSVRRVIVIMPALNEAASVESVVEQAIGIAHSVVVIDDGSTDQTGVLAARAGATVVRHPVNRGVGSAIATGLTTALSMGADVIVQIDADGQHLPSEVDVLLAALTGGVDVVIGSRFERGFEMGTGRRLVIRLIARVTSRRLGVRVDDPTSGFRAFSSHAARTLAPDFPSKYLSDTVEVLFLATERGLTIRNIPVEMRHRQGGDPSVGVLAGVGYTLRIGRIILASVWREKRSR